MTYTMNGMMTGRYLRADEPGSYVGRSAHFSGDGFSDMQLDVRAFSRDRFAAFHAPRVDQGVLHPQF